MNLCNFYNKEKEVIPAFFAALNSISSTKCWAGSPSGCNVMKSSSSATASFLCQVLVESIGW